MKKVLQNIKISVCFMVRLNKTESAVFQYCRFSLFLTNPFFQDYLEVAKAVVVSVWSK